MILPKSVRDIAYVAGLPAALALTETYGGTYLRVPVGQKMHGKTRQSLIDIMGEAAAVKFMYHYSGEKIYVPRCQRHGISERNQAIIKKYDAGVSAAIIAREQQITERQVRNILKSQLPATTETECVAVLFEKTTSEK